MKRLPVLHFLSPSLFSLCHPERSEGTRCPPAPPRLFPFPHGKGLGVRLLAIATILIAMLASITAAQTPIPTPSASPQNPLDIEVIGLRNDAGQVGCSLFNDPQAFPRDDSKVLRHIWAPIHSGKAVCQFTDLPPGQYAAVV